MFWGLAGESPTGISEGAWDTYDTGPICQTLGLLAIGGVAGRSPSARIAIMLSVGGERPESVRVCHLISVTRRGLIQRPVQSYGLIPEFGAVDLARLRRGRIVCSSFRPELWASCFCVVAQDSTFGYR
jgi:hypothetical protein